MKILLTNDDGWDAPGLESLKTVVASFADVWVVAPKSPQSGISHQMTLDRDLALVETSDNCFHLDGTPADCTRIGLTQLGVNFDWVLAGINDGANLGADVYVSGTVAAAREAWLMGKRSVAFSQYRHRWAELPEGTIFDWGMPSHFVNEILSNFFEEDYWQPKGLPDRCLINVNFPDLSHDESEQVTVEMIGCPLDPNPLPANYSKSENGTVQYRGE